MKNNIRKLRKAKNLSQAQLAEKMDGVDQRYIDRYEKSEDLRFSIALRVALALDCRLSDIYPESSKELALVSGCSYVRQLREDMGITETEMARRLGLDEKEYQKMETSMDKSTSLKLACAMVFLYSASSILNQQIISDKENEFLSMIRKMDKVTEGQAFQIIQTLTSARDIKK